MISVGCVSEAYAALSPSSRAILDEAAASVGQEKAARDSLAALKKHPRAEVVKALRDGLQNGGPWIIVAARGAQAVDAKDMIPDLLKAAETSDAWQLLLALEQLSRGTPERPKVEAFFEKKMATASNPAKIVMIDGFADGKSQLPSPLFDSLLIDNDPGVRHAVVRQFLANRESYPTAEQVRRFKLSFEAKPFQARLEAFELYAAIPKKERRSIASAFDPNLCAKETNSEVKVECEKIAKESK